MLCCRHNGAERAKAALVHAGLFTEQLHTHISLPPECIMSPNEIPLHTLALTSPASPTSSPTPARRADATSSRSRVWEREEAAFMAVAPRRRRRSPAASSASTWGAGGGWLWLVAVVRVRVGVWFGGWVLKGPPLGEEKLGCRRWVAPRCIAACRMKQLPLDLASLYLAAGKRRSRLHPPAQRSARPPAAAPPPQSAPAPHPMPPAGAAWGGQQARGTSSWVGWCRLRRAGSRLRGCRTAPASFACASQGCECKAAGPSSGPSGAHPGAVLGFQKVRQLLVVYLEGGGGRGASTGVHVSLPLRPPATRRSRSSDSCRCSENMCGSVRGCRHSQLASR
jgi:hypothetical protein